MDPLGSDGSGDGDVERRGAGRGRGRGPWTSSAQEAHAMRRPHQHTIEMQTTGPTESRKEHGKVDKSHDCILKKSTLSVHAAEFIPKSYPVKQPMQQQQQSSARFVQKHSVQDRLQMAREIPLQAEMMHEVQNSACNYDGPQQYQLMDHGQQFDSFSRQQEQTTHMHNYGDFDGGSGDYKDKHQELGGEEDKYLIKLSNVQQNLLSIIHSLTLDPGQFTSIVKPLINHLRPHLKFPSQFQEILKIIIQQSINEDNFRYSGARLCASLDSTVKPAEQTSFREILYILCKNETEGQASNWKQRDDHTEEEQKRCHGLILFLAELVTQMERTSPFGLGDLLIQLIIVILKKPAPNSVKNICQALKLAGQTLEKDKGGSRKDMENMMRSLTELVTAGRVDPHVGRMVHSVHELRNGNWGQEPPVEPTGPVDLNQAVDEPVCYGPDGKVLTAEENKFLEDVADSAVDVEDHVVLAHWTSEDDDDYDAAYTEFLNDIPKQIKNQAQ
ncbi:uncharacterized protein LOC143377017 isoform X2 [Andrena cerasifolii]|uniref:uncharacterized protein LOC143377017 isoform X2 n=1 Tax=Andrena cerasifolii TaxID=2819439 RepID=UPI00403763D7